MLLSEAIKDIKAILRSAQAKQDSISTTREGYARIKDEFDEAWQSIRNDNHEDAHHEIKMTAALCLRYLIDLPGEDEPDDEE